MKVAGRHSKALTLIELLVTVAIIAILASLLMGGLSRAKASARTAQCKNNLRQLGIALNSYVNDNGAYPWTRVSDSQIGEEPSLRAWLRTSWYGNLMLYCSQTIPSGPDAYFEHDTLYPPLFRCPGWPEVRPVPPGPNGFGTFRVLMGGKLVVRLVNPVKTVGLYGYNDCGHAPRFNFQTALGLGDRCKEGDVAVPADMFAISCGKTSWTDRPIHPLEEQTRPVGWHANRANMLFADGHVELIRSNAVMALNDTARRRWNRDNQPHPEMW